MLTGGAPRPLHHGRSLSRAHQLPQTEQLSRRAQHASRAWASSSIAARVQRSLSAEGNRAHVAPLVVGTPQSRANTARNNSPSAQMGRVSTDGSRKRKATKHSTTALVTYPEAKKRTNSSKKPCNKDNKRPCRTKAKFTGRYSSAAASSLSARVGDRGATPPAGASHLMPTMGIVR